MISKNGGRHHLEFWLNEIFGHLSIVGGILYLTKYDSNLSLLGEVVAIFSKSKMATVCHFGLLTSLKTTQVIVLVLKVYLISLIGF